MKRLRIYMRDKFRRQYCGEKKGVAELTLDHILPRSRGGDNSPMNIVTACIPCNNRKSNGTNAAVDFAVSAGCETRRAVTGAPNIRKMIEDQRPNAEAHS